MKYAICLFLVALAASLHAQPPTSGVSEYYGLGTWEFEQPFDVDAFVECVGEGGGGRGGPDSGRGQGTGGGGGAYAASNLVLVKRAYRITISSATDSQHANFAGLVYAENGSSHLTKGGRGGQASNSKGQVTHSGGDGGKGGAVANSGGGAGGGSAGPSGPGANGQNGQTYPTVAKGGKGFGNGGDGGITGKTSGLPGVYGAGGGGSAWTNVVGGGPGLGGHGYVRVTWKKR